MSPRRSTSTPAARHPRLAVVLPSLPLGDLVREQIDAVADRLARRADVERFGEADRCRADDGVIHYLKLAHRHRLQPFDNALYPLGRDYRSWEAAFLSADKLSGVTWVVDPVPGHMMVASVALRSRWDAYGRALVESHGPSTGGRALSVLAGGWADRAFHRRFDLIVPTLYRQRAVAWRDGTRPRFAPDGPIVPLPTLGSGGDRRQGSAKPSLLVLAIDGRRPGPVVRALAALEGLEIALCYPDVFDEQVRRAVERERAGRIECLPSAEPARLREHAERAGIVAVLEPEATATQMALLQEAMATGACPVVAEAPAFDLLPRAAAARVPTGFRAGEALEATVRRLLTDGELREAIGRRARRFALGRDAGRVTDRLFGLLRTSAGPMAIRRPAGEVWRRLPGQLMRRAAPNSASEELLERGSRELAALLPIPERRR